MKRDEGGAAGDAGATYPKDPSPLPAKRRRVATNKDTEHTVTPRSAPVTPPLGPDKHSSRSHSKMSGVGSDVGSDTPMEFGDEEVEAASSLATFILAASASQSLVSLSQPNSAPAALKSQEKRHDGKHDGGGNDKEAKCCSSSVDDDYDHMDPLQHKKQRRREKNRASAQQSRQRKKSHLETLEQRVEVLESERQLLHNRVEALASENQRLRKQLAQAGASPSSVEDVIEESAGAGLLAQLAQTAHALVNSH
uniref:BZIP domain-containing protein n=1 Tax=Hemiselmis tepida TaxID=464990 RepID=A0A7S0YYI0_9CRYP|mmetsp:Transcript_36597/g.93467  ORF Transcript_36597/g.93467 Transcript_36597/m.93467 type:complete len:252 (+) Transcript_36597:83-838(+)